MDDVTREKVKEMVLEYVDEIIKNGGEEAVLFSEYKDAILNNKTLEKGDNPIDVAIDSFKDVINEFYKEYKTLL